ncbi:MAG: RecX family transcriptional regulator [Finegoldia sp.]|nr:RecX family transcriptional regulator [Finegoldia sp.]
MVITDLDYNDRKGKFILKINGEKYILDYNNFEKFNISKGMEVDQELFDKIKNISNFETAFETALNFISYKLRSSYEVRNKLLSKKFNHETIDKVLEKLEDLKLIDDYSYCKIFINEKINSSDYSKRRIENYLFKKGISKDIYKDYLENLYNYDLEYEKASSIVDKKIRSWSKKYSGYQLKNKIITFLMQKGFSYDISKEIAGNY